MCCPPMLEVDANRGQPERHVANLVLSSWTKLLTRCSRVDSSLGLTISSTGESGCLDEPEPER